VVALAAATVFATLQPALALMSAPPDLDLSGVDAGVAVASADGIEVLATEQTADPSSIDSPPNGQALDAAAAPGQVGPGAPACQFSVKVHLVKSTTPGGVVHVTIQPALAAVGCTLSNTHMDSDVTVYHTSTPYWTAPTGICSLGATDPCMSTQSQGSKSCSSGCTGYWWGVGTFDISLVSGAFLVGQDSQCAFSSTTNVYRCRIVTNKVKM
jgi:hypothetical protein